MIVNQAIKYNLVDGNTFYTDSTHKKANANKNKYDDEIVKVVKERRKWLEDEINEERIKQERKPFEYKDETEEKHIKVSTTDKESGYYHRDNKEKGFMYLDHRTVDDKCNIIVDAYVTKGNVHDSGPFIERSEYIKNKFGFELKNLNKMDFNEKDREEFCLEDGDLLVCEGGEIGRCAVWHNQVENCFFQKALHRVRCNQEIILPDYLAWWFKYNCDHGGFVAIEGAKATISHLTGAKMKMLNVTVPPIGLQKQFTSFVNQVDKSKVAVQKALDETQILFDSLMQKYFG